MSTFLRFLRLISLVVWVGGIVIFAFVVAPVAFRNLASSHEAGIVVRGTLLVLHSIGLVCGAVFLSATLLLRRQTKSNRTLLAWQFVLSVVMVAVTLVSQYTILPAMEKNRQAGGGVIEALAKDDPRRLDFERLHVLSERLEGVVLFLGFGVVALIARQDAY